MIRIEILLFQSGSKLFQAKLDPILILNIEVRGSKLQRNSEKKKFFSNLKSIGTILNPFRLSVPQKE